MNSGKQSGESERRKRKKAQRIAEARPLPAKISIAIDVDELPAKIRSAALGSGHFPYAEKLDPDLYQDQLECLQIELVKMLDWVKRKGERVIILFEGRDGAGKGGTIQRLTEHLNPRSVRIVALAAPTPREAGEWYFQRYIEHLPTKGEIVVLDRSWYNRAGVECVFGFCTPEQTRGFLAEAPNFEAMLARDGIRIIKLFLAVGREMQIMRLHARWLDPLNRWKLSALDFKAVDHFDDYSAAFAAMFKATDHAAAPWTIVLANDKKRLRLETIRHVLEMIPYDNKNIEEIGETDRKIVLSAATYLDMGVL
ncbi:polyphosphate kinase 2 [Beijerinckia indica]|uniref:ADP/GDP-polyphosphate phosphotransferase n=1 Tax=Beijerinckia indica subsp. indica (strain ATCC 9039 / DSM 1715 / NCIMB 8712) TaxID=395963 RepID=B2ICZ0_BEII9|nr:polyphosphate kinase 2 [Beijerinckia indica]ACB96755.1 protein of unknown function DUF344 [Beijerinckia indica subsp. indica ATCC 9039]